MLGSLQRDVPPLAAIAISRDSEKMTDWVDRLEEAITVDAHQCIKQDAASQNMPVWLLSL